MTTRPKIVILGMLTKIPVGGVVWLIGQYAVGFQRLGFDVYYVESHGRTPSMFMETEHDDGVGKACAFLDSQLGRFGLGGSWAYHALHDDGACYGLSIEELRRLYRDAAMIINLHGGTAPLQEHAATGRLVYIGTDPGDVEIEVSQGNQETIDYLEPHVAFFTWGLNYGNPDCLLPWNQRFPFVPSPPPVVMDFWNDGSPPGEQFTTIGNWRQEYRDVVFNGERYTWSKHHEFLKVLELPQRVSASFELALSSYTDGDRALLEANGWAVRSGLEVSSDSDTYRDYVRQSRGEFSVAKDQNVRLRSGWFSERSATYLGAGRPVIVQDTGFASALPTGEGLLSFSSLDEAAAAVEAVDADIARHAKAALAVSREHLSADIVLRHLLAHCGLDVHVNRSAPARLNGAAEPASEVAHLRSVVESMAETLRVREADFDELLLEVARSGLASSQRIRYIGMLRDVRAAVETAVPRGSSVAVVAKGGDQLMQFPGRDVQCIAQDGRGEPLSFHPSCARAAIAQVEFAGWRGADYFVLPQWSWWWLDAYKDFGPYLDRRYRNVLRDDRAAIWSLRDGAGVRSLSDAIDECEHVLGRPPVILDLGVGDRLAELFPQCAVLTAEGEVLPFLDGTIDIVALGGGDESRIQEAERVATMAVALCEVSRERLAAEVRWIDERHRVDAIVSIVVLESPQEPIDDHWLEMLAETLPPFISAEMLVVTEDGPRHHAPETPTHREPTIARGTYAALRDAAAAVKGDTVVVLDSSTFVLPGWLPPLLRILRARPTVGVVCGMVVAPDGELMQPRPAPMTGEDDGSSSTYEVGAPQHNYVREVPDCVDTLLAMSSDLFRLVADTTVAVGLGSAASAAARQANRGVVYQPETVAVCLHHREKTRHG